MVNSHGICVSPMQERIGKTLQFVHQRIALFFIRTPSNYNDKHSLFIDTFIDNCERTDIVVSQLDGDLQAARSEHNTHN